MRNIAIVVLNLMLALAINRSVYGQQLTNSSPLGSIHCFEDQPGDAAVTGITNIHADETVSLDLSAGDMVVFSSDSAGEVLAISDTIKMEFSPSGATYKLHERDGVQKMEITDLLVSGQVNEVTLTTANADQIYWLVTFTPCPVAETTEQQPEAGLSERQSANGPGPVSRYQEPQLLGINNVGSVVQNIAEVIGNIELPEENTGVALAVETATSQQVAMLPTATTAPTEIATALVLPTLVASATPMPTTTRQAVAMMAPAPGTPSTGNTGASSDSEAQPLTALIVAVTMLTTTMLWLIRMMQMSLLLVGLCLGLYFGLRHRATIMASLQSLMQSETTQRTITRLQPHYQATHAFLSKEGQALVQKVRTSMIQKAK